MRPVVWIIVAIIVVGGIVWFINEQQKSPIENAADDIGDAAEEVADEIDDGTN